MAATCWQLNYQTVLGGGEIYTRFVCEALAQRGWNVVLFVHRQARFWAELGLRGVNIRPFSRIGDIGAQVPAGEVLLTHNLLDEEAVERLAATRLCAIIHMPLYERTPAALGRYARLFGVSQYVIESARALSPANLHPEPLLGVADLRLRGSAKAIVARPAYDWDRRKFRDRVFAVYAALADPLRPRRPFTRSPGLTLGIVSRVTPIKQFPQLFRILAPILAGTPDVHLEVFGSGAYASMRDFKAAVAPLGKRARFWGRQDDVATVYAGVDYVLSGLPEKEALGLNLIEAQACGTPVLAVRAPPFTETVLDGASGFLYRDPREDEGRDFANLLARIRAGMPRPDPRLARQHLDRFSPQAFADRLERALQTAK